MSPGGSTSLQHMRRWLRCHSSSECALARACPSQVCGALQGGEGPEGSCREGAGLALSSQELPSLTCPGNHVSTLRQMARSVACRLERGMQRFRGKPHCELRL